MPLSSNISSTSYGRPGFGDAPTFVPSAPLGPVVAPRPPEAPASVSFSPIFAANSLICLPPGVVLGCFSLVRAAAVAQAHRLMLWDHRALPSYLGSSPVADPSPSALQSWISVFVLSSFLPPQLMPTPDEFAAMSLPRSRPSVLYHSLEKVGVTSGRRMSVRQPASASTVSSDVASATFVAFSPLTPLDGLGRRRPAEGVVYSYLEGAGS